MPLLTISAVLIKENLSLLRLKSAMTKLQMKLMVREARIPIFSVVTKNFLNIIKYIFLNLMAMLRFVPSPEMDKDVTLQGAGDTNQEEIFISMLKPLLESVNSVFSGEREILGEKEMSGVIFYDHTEEKARPKLMRTESEDTNQEETLISKLPPLLVSICPSCPDGGNILGERDIFGAIFDEQNEETASPLFRKEKVMPSSLALRRHKLISYLHIPEFAIEGEGGRGGQEGDEDRYDSVKEYWKNEIAKFLVDVRDERPDAMPEKENSPVKSSSCGKRWKKPTTPLMAKTSVKSKASLYSIMDRNSVNLKAPMNGLMDKKSVSSMSYRNLINQTVEQVAYKVGGEKKHWNIVVDTECFLAEESRKALGLLEGLNGMQLILPRIVINELHYLKWRKSCAETRKIRASASLKWIEERMMDSSGWMHVQSLSEAMPVEPMPPVAHQASSVHKRSANSEVACSACRRRIEIGSPTVEDDILKAALHFQRIKADRQIVVLSNSTSLKIKTMAEGLLCEAPVEFYSKMSHRKRVNARRSTSLCQNRGARRELFPPISR